MTFDSRHYVPILKLKRGEKKALGRIAPGLWSKITPLFEVVERNPEKAATVDAHLKTAFQDLAENVWPYSRCFLDAHEIAPDDATGPTKAFRLAAKLGIVFTPVTGISGTAEVAAALKHRTNGLALRLTRDELEQGDLSQRLLAWMARHEVDPKDADLIMDMGAVDDFIVEGISALAEAFLQEVPDHERWRTVTMSGCAFPSSMGGVERGSHDIVERAEWRAWREGLHARRRTLQRLPTYSDCVIQHPSGVEGFDPRTMQMSASVRYTLPDSWLLIKGESTRRTPPSVQFPSLATKLAYGSLKQQFAGPGHCDGCASMKAAADRTSGFGSAEAWRRLGTIHHITKAVEELAALTWP